MKMVYSFEEVKNPNTQESIFLLGNKGAQLSEMTSIGFPVPPGFTITTQACNQFYEQGKKWSGSLENQVKEHLEKLERKMGKGLGDGKNPLFVSVRSGSYVSMPGMMDTVLNLGMNDKSVLDFAKLTNSERGSWDSYRRFVTMFGDVVMGIKHAKFEEILDEVKENKGVRYDTELDTDDLKSIVQKYKELIKKEAGKEFPQDPWEQLKMAIDAVFNSWNNKRAIAYRRINKLRNDAGTGVNIQTMVFGNLGDSSGTGVSFTRNPADGKKEHYGEFLLNAQGEDVVAGTRTPKHIDTLKDVMPNVYKELLKVYDKLEKHYKDLQDFEFTIQEGKLYLLQTRRGKRTAQAAIKIAVDMVEEGLIDKKEAVLSIKPEQLDQLLHKQLDPAAKKQSEVLTKGLPASPGAAVGKIVFNSKKAAEIVEKNPDEKLILVRTETSPEDIEGMNASQGFLTARGGITSHAAVVARGMGKCCIAGAGDIIVKEKEGKVVVKTPGGERTLTEGDWITLDGGTGEVFEGKLPVVDPEICGDFKKLMSWADSFGRIKVKTNADTPHDAKIARDYGAEGIGLCRTEHMFFGADRIKAFRKMILSEDLESRKKALEGLLEYQQKDFEGIFEVMDGLPVIIRLLDPPLHEFLPKETPEIQELSREMGISESKIRDAIKTSHEFNPMLGFRGCRLGVKYPEITEMQVRAIFQSALECQKKGIKVIPQIEIPLAGHVKEFLMIKEIIERVAEETGVKGKIDYQIGTMIEVPRAAITADEFAKEVDFMSFGTNDLTQMTCGFSRDDSGKFLGPYVENGIYKRDPFQTIDQEGVGKMMKICIEKARKVNPKIEIGICGEHGGDPESVKFCHRIGLDDVSCSPFRVPIARLAAAQANIEDRG
ncbi:MAG: pyruvate, phosphate dikinase [Candidatus Aenigmarchaeota archaeon]|nr:pyruvate, phosphate dikinase [Candidatus Aenigmarchaeota archaeon]